jgi:hypothetical protein
MAKYLDLDEDGQPDDPAVVAAMVARGLGRIELRPVLCPTAHPLHLATVQTR